MKNYSERKEVIYQQLKKLKVQLDVQLPNSSQHRVIAELIEDMDQDYYNIVVLGEFKHGKSTFVNALLNRDIMPRDVTPTTATINAAFYAEQEQLQIVKMNGKSESLPLKTEHLNRYTVSGDLKVDDVKYVKLFLQAPLLENRVVLVDTPGVNDLNEQRAQITHQYIPRADAILFLTSMTDAFKKTEQLFIKDQLKQSGIDKTIFVANFADRVDEDELDDVIDFTSRRIKSITAQNTVTIFPLSAKDALEGKLNNDTDLVNESGVVEIEEAIRKKIDHGVRGQEKITNFAERLYTIAQVIIEEVDTAVELQTESKEELEVKLLSIREWLSSQSKLEGQLTDYVRERESEIQYMVEKSINYFGVKLQEDIENRIMIYQGADIKSLVDSQLPITIRSQFSGWVDQYGDHINDLLARLKQEIVKGLSNSFQKNVQIHRQRINQIDYEADLPLLKFKSGNANVKAGAVMGGLSTVAILLGGGIFIPIVGMAGMPFISQKISEKQLENIKPELVTGVRGQIDILLVELHQNIDRYVHKQIKEIQEIALQEFDTLLQSFQAMINVQIEEKLQAASKITNYQAELEQFKHFIEEDIVKEGVAL